MRTRELVRTLLAGSVSISAAEVDNGSTDNWSIASYSLNKSAFTCSDIGNNQVVLSVTDKAGNVGSAPALVKVLGVVPQTSIALSRSDPTVTGVPANTIVLGYGAQSLTLSASDGAPGSLSNFAWSPIEGLSSATGAVTQFTPTATGSFTFAVQALNQNGCSATTPVTISVIDARCDGDKVSVCKKTGSAKHPSNQLCVAPNAVPAHLRGGASLGSCGE